MKKTGASSALSLASAFLAATAVAGCAAPTIMEARDRMGQTEIGQKIVPLSTYFMTAGDACVKVVYNLSSVLGGTQSKEQIQRIKEDCNKKTLGTVLLYRFMDPD